MIINSANLAAAARGFRAVFREALGQAPSLYEKFCTVVDSQSPEEVYNWLNDLPGMREWVGERVVHNLQAEGFTIRKKDWESTISVDRDDVLFDKLGLVKPRVQQLALAAATHYDELVFALLAAGFSSACYDGQYFFDADHPVGSPVVSTSNVTDAPLSPTAYQLGRVAMMSLVGDTGRPLAVAPTHLVVGPALELAAKEILVSERTSLGATNPHRGTAELVVTSWLAAHPTKWFLLDLSKPLKPMILQRVKTPDFVALDQPNDETVFMRKKFLYGVDAMHNAGYAFWQLAYGSTGDGEVEGGAE
jgi:phage major head subunit gpT-like protein